jgi:hypothetical protein
MGRERLLRIKIYIGVSGSILLTIWIFLTMCILFTGCSSKKHKNPIMVEDRMVDSEGYIPEGREVTKSKISDNPECNGFLSPGLEGKYYKDNSPSSWSMHDPPSRWGIFTTLIKTQTDTFVSGWLPEWHSARWIGKLQVTNSENVTFSGYSDDGLRMFLDGVEYILICWCIDGWNFEKTIFLSKGVHNITIEYFNGPLNSSYSLYWQSAHIPKQLVSTCAPQIKLSITLNPSSVRPNSITNVVVFVTDLQDNPIANHPVSLSAEAVLNSGGHIHNGNRPIGVFGAKSGRTGSDGKFTTLYTATAFGGEERITAKSDEVPNLDISVDLDVRVKGLVELSGGTNYSLVGQTSTHPNNHYGIKRTINALISIANQYASRFPGQRLYYNDISLVKGGLFDIKGNWKPPHKTHREGKNVDVRIPRYEIEFCRIVRRYGGEHLREPHPLHYHLTCK